MKAEEIYFNYGKKEVLKGTSFSLQKGEIVGIAGPNGSGKTTLIKILAGLCFPKKGRVSDLEGGIYALVENPTFYSELSGRENLEYFSNTVTKPGKTEEETDLFSCEEFLDMPVRKYSLGMKQRLALALVFAFDADYLLLDEPTNALDIDSIAAFNRRVTELKKEKGILIASHDFHELRQVCDRVLVLKDGRVAGETGCGSRKEQIYEIRVKAGVKKEHLTGLDKWNPRLLDTSIEIACGEQELPEAIRILAADGIDIYGVQEKYTDLEQQYHEILEEDGNA